jgi:uncharacterized membrane protein YkvA (DUF1232 family)
LAKSPEKRELTEKEVAELRALIAERAGHLGEADLEKLMRQEGQMEKKLAKLKGAVPTLARNIKLSFSMVKDYWKGDYREIPFWSVASVAAALGYFIAPADMVPDFIPIVGYLDDATVLAAVMAGLRQDIKAYCEAKGIAFDDTEPIATALPAPEPIETDD